MSRPPVIPAEKKIRIVLSVLQGEISFAEAARREKVSEQAIGNWRRQFLEGGRAGIEAGKAKPVSREQQLEDEVAERRKAAFTKEPTGPNQVWQLDFSEYETTTGGTWQIASCWDYWAKYEFDAHVSPTANMHDAVAAVKLALTEAETLLVHPLIDDCVIGEQTGEIIPVLTIVTDNGGPFRTFAFEAFIATHPEPRHVRTRVRTPGQNGSRERKFGMMKYEWLIREEIDNGLQLVEHVSAYRHDFNHVQPHEVIAWNRPADVYAGTANPTITRTGNLAEKPTLREGDNGPYTYAHILVSEDTRGWERLLEWS